MEQRCWVCGVQGQTDRQGRCRSCRESKAADDAGTSYGRYKARLYEQYGEQPDLPADFYRECPICHRVFLPRRKNQIYDVPACGQIAAARKYRQKQRAGHGAPAVTMEDQYGANAAYQDGRRTYQDEFVSQS